MRFLKRLGILWAAGAALLCGAGTLQAAEIIHNPVLSASAGQDINVTASLVGAAGDPRVRLYWRARGKEIFRSVEMGGSPASLNAVIPGSSVDVNGVEYYIEASLIQSGKKVVIAQSPSVNPLLNPHSVTVRKDETGPVVTPLSPADGEVLDSARPVITAAFDDADSGVDPSTVIIKLDGEVVKDRAGIQAFDTLVSWLPSRDLADGEHEIVVVVRDRSGNPGSAKWSVKVEASSSQKAAGAKGGWRWDGSLGASTEYGHVMNQTNPTSPLPYRPYGLNRATLDVSGRGSDDTFRLKVDKSDAERSDQQPVDRYTATYKNRQGVIGLGDFSPNFSELSLYNLYQLRGVTLDLQSGRLDEGHTRLVGVWGQTRRAVESGATGFSGGASNATYAQYLYGARWEFGGPYFQMGLNSVTVNDERTSVTNAGAQQWYYNYLNTADVRIGIPSGLKLFGETGVDLYSGPTPVLDSSLGSAYRAGLDWNIKPWGTRLGFDWKDLGGNFGILPGGYTTAANPGLQQDYRGYEGSFSQGLFDGQFSFDLNLNRWHDNLQATKPSTTTNDFMSIYTNVAPERWPYLVVGWTQAGQVNDADGNTATLVPNLVIDNKTSTLNLGLGYNWAIGDNASASLNVNWVRQAFRDQAAKKLGQDLAGDNVVVSAFASRGASSFNASLGFGGSEQPALAAADTALGSDLQPKSNHSFNASLRWNQSWKRSVVDSYVGYDLSSSSNEAAAFNALSKSSGASNRSTFSVGGNYNFAELQRIFLGLSMATVATDTTSAGTTTTDNVAELYSNLRYDLSF